MAVDQTLWTIQKTREWATLFSYTSSGAGNEVAGSTTSGGTQSGEQSGGSDGTSFHVMGGDSTDVAMESGSNHSEDGVTGDTFSFGLDQSYNFNYTSSRSVLENTGSAVTDTDYSTAGQTSSGSGNIESGSTMSSYSETGVTNAAGSTYGDTNQGSESYSEAADESETSYEDRGETFSNVASLFRKTGYDTLVTLGSTTSSGTVNYETSTDSSDSETYTVDTTTNTVETESFIGSSDGGTFLVTFTENVLIDITTLSSSSTSYTTEVSSSSEFHSDTEDSGSITGSQTMYGAPFGSILTSGSTLVTSSRLNSAVISNAFPQDTSITSPPIPLTYALPTSTTVSKTMRSVSGTAPSTITIFPVTTTSTTATYSNALPQTSNVVRSFPDHFVVFVAQTGNPFEIINDSYICPDNAVVWIGSGAVTDAIDLLQNVAISATGTFQLPDMSSTWELGVFTITSEGGPEATYDQPGFATSLTSEMVTTTTAVGTTGTFSTAVPVAGKTSTTTVTTNGFTTLTLGTVLVAGSISNTSTSSAVSTVTTATGGISTRTDDSETFGGMTYSVSTIVSSNGIPDSPLNVYVTVSTTTHVYVPQVGSNGRFTGFALQLQITSQTASFTVPGPLANAHMEEGDEASFYDGQTIITQENVPVAALWPAGDSAVILRPQRPAGVASPFADAVDRTPHQFVELGGARFPWAFGIGQQDGVSTPIPMGGGVSTSANPTSISTSTHTGTGTATSATVSTSKLNSRSHLYSVSWKSGSISITELARDSNNTSGSTASSAGVLSQVNAITDSFYVVKSAFSDGQQFAGGWSPDGRAFLVALPSGAVDSTNLSDSGDDGDVETISQSTFHLSPDSGLTGYRFLQGYELLVGGGPQYTVLPRYSNP